MQEYTIKWYAKGKWNSMSVRAEGIKNLRARIYKDYLMKGIDTVQVHQVQKYDDREHWIGTAFTSSDGVPMYQITNFINDKKPQMYRLSKTGALLDYDVYWRYI